jgi:hypothetical protein
MMIKHAPLGCGKADHYRSLSKKFDLKPTAHVGIHRIARNNHRANTAALLAVECAVFESLQRGVPIH